MFEYFISRHFEFQTRAFFLQNKAKLRVLNFEWGEKKTHGDDQKVALILNNIRAAGYWGFCLQYFTNNNFGTLIGGRLDCTSVDTDKLKQSLQSNLRSYKGTTLTKLVKSAMG